MYIGRLLHACVGIVQGLGFGAIAPGNTATTEVSHCFPLARPTSHRQLTEAEIETQAADGVLHGLGELLQAYRNTAGIVKMKGPTVYSHVIEKYAPAGC
jgi:hypothetical protein